MTFYRYESLQLSARLRGRLANVHHANDCGTSPIVTSYTLRLRPPPGGKSSQYLLIEARTMSQGGAGFKMQGLEMHAPKIDDSKILLNILFRGEPAAWKRAGHAFSRFFDHPDNVKAKDDLVERFEWDHPKWRAIEKRNLGVQLFFATLFDSKDVSNMQKLVEDAFNKKIWHDDHQIKEVYARAQVVSRTPFTQLVVYLLDVGA